MKKTVSPIAGTLHHLRIAFLFFTFLSAIANASAQDEKTLDNNAITWHTLGIDENSSMPLGNGDIAVNAWTEQNGDIVLLVAKSDAWDENGRLLKLGKVRISISPDPFANSTDFAQTLDIGKGAIIISSGKNIVRIRVDANHPVIRLEAKTEKPVRIKAISEIWRKARYHLDRQQANKAELGYFEWQSDPDGLTFYPDTVFEAKNDRIAWCHFNAHSRYPITFEREHLESLLPKYADPLIHRCFGIMATGKNLVSKGHLTLESRAASRTNKLDLHALAEQVSNPGEWLSDMTETMARTEKIADEEAWAAHLRWWDAFWNRSWIIVSGTPEAEKVSIGYAMQRYMTACAGRGSQPIKFNGSLFTVGRDLPVTEIPNVSSHDEDYRHWGSCFWNQNTRHIYWPLIASGDYDMLMPWFEMYLRALPLAKDRTKLYYGHEGAAFIETMFFWGLPNTTDFGWDNPGPDPQSAYMRYHYQGGLEVAAQMLDYYDNTQDTAFLKRSLVPFADAIVTFYDLHWKKDINGKSHFDPSQSIETYQISAINPTPDLAGLKSILPRLLALPENCTTEKQRKAWRKQEQSLPGLPLGTTSKGKIPPFGAGEIGGKAIILPAEKYGKPCNVENPELYAIFPYRLFGIGKPNLQLAVDTYGARLFPHANCWGQDGQEAALVGLTEDAEKAVAKAFTSYGKQRFPWFWAQNMDYSPDMDNGGGAMTTLQYMLMQTDGKSIRLIPSWPKDWKAYFKLHAPCNTTVEARVENGEIISLKVTPESRTGDVLIGRQ